MKVLITGATGLIGKAIVKQCHKKGVLVHYLTTSKHKLSQEENYKGFYWNPRENEIDNACFDGVDAIINLAGATISKRWTSSYKKEILQSRIQTLQLLKHSLGTIEHNVEHIISASAIGVYPDSLTNYYEETATETSSSFLGTVVEAWEHEVDNFKKINIKTTKVRIGLVLDEKEGALPQLAKPIKYGAGAAFGSGKQWQSWIHITDLARLFVYVQQQQLEGVYNAVAPNPVTNEDLTKAVARTFNKPLWLPNIPKIFMRMVLGEMHILLFESQRVSSKKIEEHGFHYKYSNLQPALEDLLG